MIIQGSVFHITVFFSRYAMPNKYVFRFEFFHCSMRVVYDTVTIWTQNIHEGYS